MYEQTYGKLPARQVLPFFQEQITNITPKKNKTFSCMYHEEGGLIYEQTDPSTEMSTAVYETENYLTNENYENSYIFSTLHEVISHVEK